LDGYRGQNFAFGVAVYCRAAEALGLHAFFVFYFGSARSNLLQSSRQMSKVSRVGALVLCFVYKLYFAPFKRNSAVLGTHSLLNTRALSALNPSKFYFPTAATRERIDFKSV
jgi:hypothetical protein